MEPAFWAKLGDLKLEDLKLDEGPLTFTGTYKPNNHPKIPGALSIDATTLTEGAAAPPDAAPTCSVTGRISCVNTIERLAAFDRQAATDEAGAAIWAAIKDGSALQNPALLQQAVGLAYCDLKRYRYHHWLAFPVLQPPTPITLVRPPQSLVEHLGAAERAQEVVTALQTLLGRSPPPLSLLSMSTAGAAAEVGVHPLTSWEELADADGMRFLAFIDPSNTAEHPGWPLRNALVLAAVQWSVRTLPVLCLRTRKGQFDADASLVMTVELPELDPGFVPKTVGGWSANAHGKPGPRVADLGPSMDPRRLAASAVDLNLQLMRWRAAPTLDVGAVARARCLLFGAGTLGCSVARTLLGWGVRKITFVDNSRVAFSNPVRQSLFTFEDCLHGGRPKADAAADAVKKIFPDVDVTGVKLTIPMPGHPPAEAEIEGVRNDVRALEELILGHDVVFLLLDTREARWLPTLLCAVHDKLAITGALGFDGFLVMRHGGAPHSQDGGNAAQTSGERSADAFPTTGTLSVGRLGCYFCSDIVAPANSTIDRTMDQQCTVARPGLSGVCGSLAAELMAAVLQHPAGKAAPAAGAPGTEGDDASGRDAPLGQVPHMIRGQFTGFSQVCMTGQAFAQCPGCCPSVVQEYRARGTEFVVQAVSEPQYLEDLTGLTELHRASEAVFEAAEARVEGGGGGNDGEGEGEGWEEL